MTVNEIGKIIFGGKKVYKSSNYGKRTYVINGRRVTDYHYGWDIVYRQNGSLKSTTLYAVDSGTVTSVGRNSSAGNYIYINYPNLGITLFYCHLKKVYLKKNKKVKKGTKVGLSGTTGNSTGIHLHLGTRILGSNVWVNPGYIYLTKYNYVYIASKYLKAYGKKTTYNVNLRKSATLRSESLLVIPKNKTVRILKENEYSMDGFKWDKVKYDGEVGYVANEYLKDYIRQTTAVVNVRIRPGTNYTIVKTLKKNKKVKVNKRYYNKSWDQIKL